MTVEQSGGSLPEQMRVSDAERREVVDALRRHCADGRITLDEFAERAGQVYGARTAGELAVVRADLPEPLPAPDGTVPGAPRRQATRWVVGIMGAGTRKGRWRPDEQTTALAIMGGCYLDLRQAEIDGSVVDIHAVAIMGGVDIVVPEGIQVELTGVAIMGGKECRVKDVPVRPGTPVVRVHAFAFWGGVTVRTRRERGTEGRDDKHHEHRLEQHQRRELERQRRREQVEEQARARVERHLATAEQHATRALERAGRYGPLVEEVLGRLGESRQPPTPTAPDGTVTVLFSDIEGFTDMTERLGDIKAQEVLRSHNALVRREIGACGGYEVKSQGDSFMIAFAGARKGLRCAVQLQRAFAQWSIEHPEQAFRVRIGLHTGEAIREDDDLFGRTVILASRIAATAGGGQVLVSSLLKELTESSGEFCFGPGREVSLKGLSRAQVVHEVDWTGVLPG